MILENYKIYFMQPEKRMEEVISEYNNGLVGI